MIRCRKTYYVNVTVGGGDAIWRDDGTDRERCRGQLRLGICFLDYGVIKLGIAV